MRLVVQAGDPDDTEIAAVTAVLVGMADTAVPGDDMVRPAWSRAARLEAIGQAPFTSAADPRLSDTPSRTFTRR